MKREFTSMTMQVLLERVHKEVGAVAGDICMSLTLGRVIGGKAAISRWIFVLRSTANELERWLEKHNEKTRDF